MKIKLIVENTVINKIKYLCDNIPNNEWSGLIVYNASELENLNGDKILKVVDIIPMNKGDETYTEFNFNEFEKENDSYRHVLVDYFIKYPEYFNNDYKTGLIHSHQNFNVFFSGVDKNELKNNCKLHSFYLSLIINNNLDSCAKIAFYSKTKSKSYIKTKSRNKNGQYVNHKTIIQKQKDEIVIDYDCEVDIKNYKEEIITDSFFLNRVGFIIDQYNERKSKENNLFKAHLQKQIEFESFNKEFNDTPIINENLNYDKIEDIILNKIIETKLFNYKEKTYLINKLRYGSK